VDEAGGKWKWKMENDGTEEEDYGKWMACGVSIHQF